MNVTVGSSDLCNPKINHIKHKRWNTKKDKNICGPANPSAKHGMRVATIIMENKDYNGYKGYLL